MRGESCAENGGPGLEGASQEEPMFNLSLLSQGCARNLQNWLHNNFISIVGICLGVGLLEVIRARPHSRLALQSLDSPAAYRVSAQALGKAHA